MTPRRYILHVVGFGGTPREYFFFSQWGRNRAARRRFPRSSHSYIGKYYMRVYIAYTNFVPPPPHG